MTKFKEEHQIIFHSYSTFKQMVIDENEPNKVDMLFIENTLEDDDESSKEVIFSLSVPSTDMEFAQFSVGEYQAKIIILALKNHFNL